MALWERISLCLIHYRMLSHGFTLWLLRKTRDGATGWVKAKEMSLAEMGLKNKCFVGSAMLCEVAKTVLLVFTINNKAYSYSLKYGELRIPGLCYPRLFPYSKTLRPCGEQEELLGRRLHFPSFFASAKIYECEDNTMTTDASL
ncbi:hypothetical protein MUK42_33188 [Musa troglodytarum]|uniref:Uncharacterized protein n=1 Tax=Musa troglodytarum TaxID=320322 RepID=A0A9E7JUM6_9LILI|nr:hypothetical protein MUK42_33188 [Musa troglodytarum]